MTTFFVIVAVLIVIFALAMAAQYFREDRDWWETEAGRLDAANLRLREENNFLTNESFHLHLKLTEAERAAAVYVEITATDHVTERMVGTARAASAQARRIPAQRDGGQS